MAARRPSRARSTRGVALNPPGPDFLRLATGTASASGVLAARKLAARYELRDTVRVTAPFEVPRPRDGQ